MEKSTATPSALSPKFVVMGFLYIRPMHGYELHKQLDTELREVWRISQSQVYNILKNLQRDGWVIGTTQPQVKRPDRELLILTEAGKTAFETWLYSVTPGSAKAIRVEFITRLFFASNISENLGTQLIQEQAKALNNQIEQLYLRLYAIRQDQVFNRMGLTLRIRQLEVIEQWVESCEQYFIE